MIILVTGSQGAGKTILLTMYAYNAHKAGQTVYSNYTLNFPHQKLDFEKMMRCEYNNATIVISEAHNWGLNSRDAMKEPNKTLVRSFIPQIRKQGVTLFLDTQRWNLVDKALRLQAEIWIMCRKVVLINKKWCEVLQSHQYPDDTPVKIEADYTFIDSERSYTKEFIANKYYNMYDTREAVQILEQVKDEKQKKKTDKKKVKA